MCTHFESSPSPVNEIPRLDWLAVKTRAEARLELLRQQNDNPGLDTSATAALRGEIRALKWLLDLPEQAALESQTPPPAYGGETF